MKNEYAVTACGLSKNYRLKKGGLCAALSSLDLQIRYGQLTALIGPDGAGKTTFMHLTAGLTDPSSGTLTVLGLDTASHAQEIQTQLSYMPQRFGLYEDLTVAENMDLYADLHGMASDLRPKRFAKLLSMTGLSPFTDRLAGKLSGGMKQKLGLACTLVRTPKLLLLDEPTVGVDPLSRRELWAILQQLTSEENLTVLVSTAYMEEAALCSQVLILNQGKLLAQGTPDSLTQKSAGRCFELMPPPSLPARSLQAALLNDREEVIDAVPDGGRVRFSLWHPENLRQLQVLRRLPDLVPQLAAPKLEDSFMMLLRQAASPKNGTKQNFGETDGDKLPLSSDLSSFNAASSLEKAPSLAEAPVEIQVQDLVRRFGDFMAVDHTTFQVHRGEIFGLLGPNGAGKTTTFKMLCGLLPASSGFLSVAGVNVRTARTQSRVHLGYVAQKFSLYSTLTVLENLRFFGGAYGLPEPQLSQRIDAVLKEYGLSGQINIPAGELPGGYKQRLSMAAALLHEPRLLFLDEPTSGIDPLARRAFWQQITALASAGTTIIITTHFMEEAEYCDRILIQDQGRMLALGTPAQIRQQGNLTHGSMNEAFIKIVEQARAESEKISAAKTVVFREAL